MSNKLSQIIVLILSILLAFYCVHFHGDTIFKTLNVDENTTTIEPVLEKNSIANIIVNEEVVVDEKEGVLEMVEDNNSSEIIATEDEPINNSLEQNSIESVIVKEEVIVIEEKEELIDIVQSKEKSESLKDEDEFSSLEKRMLEELKKEEDK